MADKKEIDELKRRIIKEVQEHMGWDETKAGYWYKTPNPNFGGSSPEVLVKKDRGHRVLQFIAAARYEYGPQEKTEVLPVRGKGE